MDSHDHKVLEERLIHAHEALIRSEQLALAGRYAGAVMHEVNNPLEALGNLIYLARMDVRDTEAVSRFLCLAEQQLRHVQEIAKTTLSFYRCNDATEEVDLVTLLDSALRMQRPQLLSKGIDVRRIHPDAAAIRANAGEMMQVFTNLIANSVDALGDGGKLDIRVSRSGDHFHILIADNGCGIPPAKLERLFEPFQSSKKGKGTGLGLWMCKTLVEKHKGRIRHRSSISGRRGTAFRVSLPG